MRPSCRVLAASRASRRRRSKRSRTRSSWRHHEQRRPALGGRTPARGRAPVGVDAVEIRGGLVREDEGGVPGQGARDRHALLLPHAELRRPVVAAGPASPTRVERLARCASGRGRPAGAKAHAERHVLVGTEVGQQVEGLEQVADVGAPGADRGRPPRDRSCTRRAISTVPRSAGRTPRSRAAAWSCPSRSRPAPPAWPPRRDPGRGGRSTATRPPSGASKSFAGRGSRGPAGRRAWQPRAYPSPRPVRGSASAARAAGAARTALHEADREEERGRRGRRAAGRASRRSPKTAAG